ncbi:hypothetical protein ACP70R_038808 [Stipagrostis hirtigluma subsp. patula]
MAYVGVPVRSYSSRVRRAERAAAAAAAAERAKLDEAVDVLLRWMEAGGLDDDQQPVLQIQPTTPTPSSHCTWRFVKIFLRCFGVTLSLVLVAWVLFTDRHEKLDPYQKTAMVILDLIIAALVFVGTRDELFHRSMG